MKVFITSLLVALSLLAPATAFAATSTSSCGTGDNTSKGQALQGLNATGNTDCSGSGVDSLAYKVTQLLSFIVGVVAVVMVIVSGFKYITSGGDSNAVSSAKRTLIYAVVGLAIVVLAQIISHYTITATHHGITPPTP